jgi:hypothetical protein
MTIGYNIAKTACQIISLLFASIFLLLMGCTAQKPDASVTEVRTLEYNSTIVGESVQLYNNSRKGVVVGTLNIGDRTAVKSQYGDMCSVVTGDQSGWIECEQLELDDAINTEVLPTPAPYLRVQDVLHLYLFELQTIPP